MRFIDRTLAFVIVLSLTATGVWAQEDRATADDDRLQGRFLENATFEIDGALDEPEWAHAGYHQLTLNGVADPDDERFLQLFVGHNGTDLLFAVHGRTIDGLTLQFQGSPNGVSGFHADAVAISNDGNLRDLHWDLDAQDWRADDEVEACSVQGEVGVAEDQDRSTIEGARPLDGDGCDTVLRFADEIFLRIAVDDAEAQETYRWPQDSVAEQGDLDRSETAAVTLQEEIETWGTLVLQDSEEVAAVSPPPQRDPIDTGPGWHTGEDRHDQEPVQGIPREENPAYDASERDLPAPAFVTLAVIGLAVLGAVELVRRQGR